MSSPAKLYCYEDARGRAFEPFASTRPVATLAAGTAPIWSRWQMALQAEASGIVGADRLGDFEEPSTPEVVVTDVLPAGSIVAHSRFAAALEVIPWRGAPEGWMVGNYRSADADAAVWRSGGRIAAVRLGRDLRVEELRDAPLESVASRDGPIAEINGHWIDEVWDLIRFLPEQLTDDIVRLRLLRGMRGIIDEHWPVPAHATVLGEHPVIVHGTTPGGEHTPPAVIEPQVVLDASAGPIYVGSGSHVHAFTRINGPCYIGRNVNVMGGDISTCSIGDVCKIRGEMSNTVFIGYSNKGHDGFIGHSYLGRWVNLGASTVTSNLKNTYGSVALWTPSGIRDTGLQFLGTLFGDHAKTGIGLKLTTGSVLGAGANVYGTDMPPKVVPPFAWGDAPPYSVYRKDKFLEAAERMMSRRKMPLTDRARRHWSAVHDTRWAAASDAP